MSFGKSLAVGLVGAAVLGGGLGYAKGGSKVECASAESVDDRIFCGLGMGSSEEAIDKLHHYVEVVGDFFLTFTDNPEVVPAAVPALEFGLGAHPNMALRVPEGMPELAANLTNDQIMAMAQVSLNDLKRYWIESRRVDIGNVWLEPMVPAGRRYEGCNGLEGDKFAGLYCPASRSVALSEHARNGVPVDASSQQMHIYIRSVLAHELGHAVQHVRNATDAGRAALGMTMEEQATCLGGNAMAGDTYEVREYVASYVASAAFNNGVNASNCGI